ncbi:MAG: helix-hairpin-helix domain-containing protein [Candidatus Hydrogenedentota bacterium]
MFNFKFSVFQKLIILLSAILITVGGLVLIKPDTKEQSYDDTTLNLKPLSNLELASPLKIVTEDEQIKLQEEVKININTATVDELTTVPGIGEATARAIVEYREKNRKEDEPVFYKLSDLEKVPRMGEKKIEKLSQYLTVGWGVMQLEKEKSINIEEKEDKININTADVIKLQDLPGIGPKTAENIIKYRETKQFEKIEDIMNVPRIGPTRFEKIKDKITVGEEMEKLLKKKSLTKPKKVEKINLNKATMEELITLPGIGEQTAKNIIEYRTELKKFRSLEDLLEIPGFGEKKLEKIRPYVEVK